MPAYSYVSPSYNLAYDMGAVFPVVDATTPADVLNCPGQRTLIVDFLDQGWQNILNQIRFWTNATYIGQKWTTMCYVQQGTFSLWMLDLAFNGLSSPLQLQNGMVLRFPLISEVQRVISNQSANNGIGQIISIGPPNLIGV